MGLDRLARAHHAGSVLHRPQSWRVDSNSAGSRRYRTSDKRVRHQPYPAADPAAIHLDPPALDCAKLLRVAGTTVIAGHLGSEIAVIGRESMVIRVPSKVIIESGWASSSGGGTSSA